MIQNREVPGQREIDIGTVWLAQDDVELRRLGGACGYSGLYVDEKYEAERLRRSALNRAVRQLPAGEPSLISMELGRPTQDLMALAERRLATLGENDPRVAGVLIRSTFFEKDVLPQESMWLIENPNMRGVASNSNLVAVLCVDHLRHFRTAEGAG